MTELGAMFGQVEDRAEQAEKRWMIIDVLKCKKHYKIKINKSNG